jgi:hypothetical protein
MTRDDFMDLFPYLVMASGLTIALIELQKVFA